MVRLVSYLHDSSNLESDEKCFVCVVDDKVVGNITTMKMNLDANSNLIPVIFPDWRTFLTILQSPNHKFIEQPIPVLPGTTWNGSHFIAHVESSSQMDENDEAVYTKVNNSCIYHEKNYLNDRREYFLYEIDLLRQFLEQNAALEINVIMTTVPNPNASFENNNRTVAIYLNTESMIVEDNLIELPKEPNAKLAFNEKQYTVNANIIDDIKGNDIILECSKPNIKNLEISGLYPDILPKFQHVSPCFYKSVSKKEVAKTVDTLTLFSLDPTRENKLQEIHASFANHRNEPDCFGDELTSLLETTKILINVHRTESEITLEELRVLPALMQKVLVVSEVSPLTELVPFGAMIILATYDNIVQKTKEVLDNYDTYYSQIFTEQNINMLNNLHAQNSINIANKLNAFLNA